MGEEVSPEEAKRIAKDVLGVDPEEEQRLIKLAEERQLEGFKNTAGHGYSPSSDVPKKK